MQTIEESWLKKKKKVRLKEMLPILFIYFAEMYIHFITLRVKVTAGEKNNCIN